MMSNYYNDMLAALMGTGEYLRDSQREAGNPWRTRSSDDRSAKMQASQYEDEKLRGLMGSKTKRSKKDRTPAGAYAMADYPMLSHATDWARTGNMPGGSATIGMWMKELQDPGLRDANSEKRRQWAEYQQRLLGGW